MTIRLSSIAWFNARIKFKEYYAIIIVFQYLLQPIQFFTGIDYFHHVNNEIDAAKCRMSTEILVWAFVCLASTCIALATLLFNFSKLFQQPFSRLWPEAYSKDAA